VATKVGDDRFGEYVRLALAGFGVDIRFVGTHPGLKTPVVFAELDPPEDPRIVFYREPKAPDMTLELGDVDVDLLARVPILWVTGTGLSDDPSRLTHHAILAARDRRRHTVLDLDWRPVFWPSPRDARRQYRLALRRATIAIGNRAECAVAVGEADPDETASRLLDLGLEVAVVKLGGEGVLVATANGSTRVPPIPVQVVCGLGAGDAFGGAFCHGLLAGVQPAEAARLGNAAGAIVAARLACADAMPTLSELDATLKEASRAHAS
jgi:5-dehydro-2-deoxygluconokinase